MSPHLTEKASISLPSLKVDFILRVFYETTLYTDSEGLQECIFTAPVVIVFSVKSPIAGEICRTIS